MNRFFRNQQTITNEQQAKIRQQKILVIGLGGLGSHVIEGLVRIGFMKIGICDYDVIEDTNLNRQLLALENNIGKTKCELAYHRIKEINSQVEVTAYSDKYPNQKILNDLNNYDLIIDCLDSIEIRKQLEDDCLLLDKKLIYGTVAGNYGYFGVISNQNKIMKMQLNNENQKKQLGNLYYTVAIVANMQILLCIKVILEQEYLKNGFYAIDLSDLSIEEVILN